MLSARPLHRVFGFIAAVLFIGVAATPADAALVSVLERTTPFPFTFPQNPDASLIPDGHEAFVGSDVGDVTASLKGVDLSFGNSGCEAADFAGFAAGSVALMARSSTCTFSVQALNAQAAGAAAVIIFDNETPSDTDATLNGTELDILALFTTKAIGDELANLLTSGEIVRVKVTEVPDVTVPEPIALAVFGVGLAGLGVARRRRIQP